MAKVHRYTDDDGNPVKVDGKIKCQVRGRERRPDGTWGYFKETVVGVSEAEVVARDLELRNQDMAEQLANRSAPGEETVAEVVLWFLDRYKNETRTRGKPVEPESYESARADLMLFAEHVKPDTKFRDITPAHVRDAVEKRTKQRYVRTVIDENGDKVRVYESSGEEAAAGTRNRMLGVLRALGSEAMTHDKHQFNIAAGVSNVSYGAATSDDKWRVRLPPWEDLATFAKDLDRPTSPVRTRWGGYTERARWHHVHDPDLWFPSDRFWLFVFTGWGFSEARGARTIDWHTDEGELVLHKTQPRRHDKPREYGKTDARMVERRVPVPDVLVPCLERLVAYSRSGHLLTGPNGKLLAYETWNNQMLNTSEATGIKLTTHQLRHVAASLWIEAALVDGRDWRPEVMKFGGWASTDMVEERYGHLTDSTVRRARGSLNKLLSTR